MKLVGTFNGTGAAVYLCVGQRVESVELNALIASTIGAFWNRSMRSATNAGGISVAVDGVRAGIVVGSGFSPYNGGELLTAANQTTTAYGEGVYLGWDRTDYSKSLDHGAAVVLDAWTFAATTVGSFNANTLAAAAGGRIGVGSEIDIMDSTGKVHNAIITVLADGAGGTASDVTLNVAVPSGRICRISGKYSMIPLPLGSVTLEGVKIAITSPCNANNEVQSFVIDDGMQA